MTFGATLGQHLMTAASPNISSAAIDFKNKKYMKAAANNINIETHQLFSKQWILDVCVTIVQRKTSGDLIRTYF